MTKFFNTEKCLELLKLKYTLQKKCISLREYNKNKNDELIKLLTLVEDQNFWESRQTYKQIFNLFVNRKITIRKLLTEFSKLKMENINSVRMCKSKLTQQAFDIHSELTEINFQFNNKSVGFSTIISDLVDLLEIYNPDATLEMNLEYPELTLYGMSEKYLRLIIEEEFLPKLQNYCSKS